MQSAKRLLQNDKGTVFGTFESVKVLCTHPLRLFNRSYQRPFGPNCTTVTLLLAFA